MQYPFPPREMYQHMSQGQLGQAYANLEQHFGRREHLPAPFDNRQYLHNDHQHAAMHMDFLQDQIANHEQYRAEWWANAARAAAARDGYRPF